MYLDLPECHASLEIPKPSFYLIPTAQVQETQVLYKLTLGIRGMLLCYNCLQSMRGDEQYLPVGLMNRERELAPTEPNHAGLKGLAQAMPR